MVIKIDRLNGDGTPHLKKPGLFGDRKKYLAQQHLADQREAISNIVNFSDDQARRNHGLQEIMAAQFNPDLLVPEQVTIDTVSNYIIDGGAAARIVCLRLADYLAKKSREEVAQHVLEGIITGVVSQSLSRSHETSQLLAAAHANRQVLLFKTDQHYLPASDSSQINAWKEVVEGDPALSGPFIDMKGVSGALHAHYRPSLGERILKALFNDEPPEAAYAPEIQFLKGSLALRHLQERVFETPEEYEADAREVSQLYATAFEDAGFSYSGMMLKQQAAKVGDHYVHQGCPDIAKVVYREVLKAVHPQEWNIDHMTPDNTVRDVVQRVGAADAGVFFEVLFQRAFERNTALGNNDLPEALKYARMAAVLDPNDENVKYVADIKLKADLRI